MFFSLGLCVSYDRMLQISADIANSVCQKFIMEDVVCPPKMCQGLFTTGAVDNIDHNPSSTTARDSFHGTGISLIQHPSTDFTGQDHGVGALCGQDSSTIKSIAPLPSFYTNVLPASLRSKQFVAPVANGPMLPKELNKDKVKEEYEWLKSVERAIDKPKLDAGDWVSWSTYHSKRKCAV